MFVVSADPSQTDPVEASRGTAQRFGISCAFAGCSGFFHSASGSIGVVLCPPWGFEEIVMRKSWRLLAEAIAAAGYPCLRFDYPGTANALGRTTEIQDVSAWVASIHTAADFLRRTTGARRFIFLGQSLGAALAVEAARKRGDVVALHLIAPVVSGRAHARELAATAILVADKLGIKAEPSREEALSVMGFALSPAFLDSLKALDLRKLDRLDVEHVVVYDELDRKAAAETVENMRRLGAQVHLEQVAPYHLMVSDATVIQALPAPAERVIAALRATVPPVAAALPVTQLPSQLATATFKEEPLRFGPQHKLFGILCLPTLPRMQAPAVVLLNRGLNPHTGWRRVSVDHARGLAAAGLVSLRIDAAGLGESGDPPDSTENSIYADRLLEDVAAAIDLLAARGHTRIMLAGVCSGAYIALNAAKADPRVTDVVAINPQRFVWNPKESFEDVIRFGLRSVNDYVGDLKSGHAWRKLIERRERLVPALMFLAKRQIKHAVTRIPLRWRSTLLPHSMSGRVLRMFASFAARGTRVSLVFSDRDPGLLELRSYFGPEGRVLAGSSISVSMVPDADHNLTTTRASDWMLAHLIAVACERCGREEPRLEEIRAERDHRSVCPAA